MVYGGVLTDSSIPLELCPGVVGFYGYPVDIDGCRNVPGVLQFLASSIPGPVARIREPDQRARELSVNLIPAP